MGYTIYLFNTTHGDDTQPHMPFVGAAYWGCILGSFFAKGRVSHDQLLDGLIGRPNTKSARLTNS